MTVLNDNALNLQEMLADYRCGKRELLTYDELVQIDIQIGSQQAQIAALRTALRSILHEQAMIAYIARIP
jgi:hypothetical protein